ncbi:MAG: substrate-binding domain-containing protein [Cyanobacteriota bacterium]|nr:substrate-binding domain-containing protein [Cyanobacteriota bacterium]
MAPSRKALLQIPAVLLTLAFTLGLFTVPALSFLNHPAVAQSSSERAVTFKIPESLAQDTTVKVNGSSSMSEPNKALEQRFKKRFPDAEVELSATGTSQALEDLEAGKLDIAAVGRPLTEEEKAAGLVAVPLGREKLAIIVSPDNPFDADLTSYEFSEMFRGAITNWSEVGGPELKIRFIDRPDDSDTRLALYDYEVFYEETFETGENAIQVSEDTTDAVVAKLGNDGIGYAVADQVSERDDVKIIPIQELLPDDPNYAYSQYRGYVYNKDNQTPAVVAFLGLATTEPGQEVVATTEEKAASDSSATADSEKTSEAQTSESTETASDSSPEQLAQVPSPAETETGGPSWLLPLFLIGTPLLLWYLGRDLGIER